MDFHILAPNPTGLRSNIWLIAKSRHLHLLMLLLIALLLRLHQLDSASLWMDEVYTIRESLLPMSTLWVTAYDANPPLYFTLIKCVLAIGHSEFALRLPSAILGALTVCVIYEVTRLMAGREAGFCAGLLLCLSYTHLEYSQEARAYALLGLCIALSFLGLVKMAQDLDLTTSTAQAGRQRFPAGTALYAVATLAALYSHNSAVFYWLGIQLSFIICWAALCRFERRILTLWFLCNFGIFLLWLPWLSASLELMERNYFNWLRHMSPKEALNIWQGVHGFSKLPTAYTIGSNILLAGMALWGSWQLRKQRAQLSTLLILLASSSLLIWAWGLFSQPVFMTRSILWGSLFSAILVGVGLARSWRPLAALSLTALMAAQAYQLQHYFNNNAGESQDLRAAGAKFSQLQRPGDAVLVRPPYFAGPFFHYVDEPLDSWDIWGWDCRLEHSRTISLQRQGPTALATLEPSPYAPGNAIPAKPGQTLWVIDSNCFSEDMARTNSLFFPNWSYRRSLQFKGVNIHILNAKN